MKWTKERVMCHLKLKWTDSLIRSVSTLPAMALGRLLFLYLWWVHAERSTSMIPAAHHISHAVSHHSLIKFFFYCENVRNVFSTLKMPGPISQDGNVYSNDASSPKISWFQISFKSVKPFWHNKRLRILQLVIPLKPICSFHFTCIISGMTGNYVAA